MTDAVAVTQGHAVETANSRHRYSATVGDYLLRLWLPSERTRVKPSTANSYERNIRLHIIPNIGAIPLQRLQPEDLDELYVKLLTDGKRNGGGGGLSAKSVRNVQATRGFGTARPTPLIFAPDPSARSGPSPA